MGLTLIKLVNVIAIKDQNCVFHSFLVVALPRFGIARDTGSGGASKESFFRTRNAAISFISQELFVFVCCCLYRKVNFSSSWFLGLEVTI